MQFLLFDSFDLFDFIGGFFNIVWATLCMVVYGFVKSSFNLFMKIAELDILKQTNLEQVYQRITIIVTIVMTFYVTFEYVKYIISPETLTDKQKGATSVLKRIAISILLIAFVPTIFTKAFDLQHIILEQQIFSKLILGNEAWDKESFGSSFAADTFSAFLRVDYEDCGSNCGNAKKIVNDTIETMRESGAMAVSFKAVIDQMEKGVVFDGFLALIFGIYVIYVISLYCFDVGVRYAQLVFLQVMSPVAIISYIVPSKDNMFNKWLKQCITTYLDLFIRIGIIYFVLLIIQIVGRNLNPLHQTINGQTTYDPLVYIFMICGLLIFAQRAPKLVKDLFPNGGSASIGFGLSSKDRLEPLKKSYTEIKKPVAATAAGVKSVASALAAIKTGNLGALINNKYQPNGFKGKVGNLANKAFAVGKAGVKGFGAGMKTGRFGEAISEGTSSINQDESKLKKGGGLIVDSQKAKRKLERFKTTIENKETIEKEKKEISTAVKDIKLMKDAESYITAWDQNNIGDAKARTELRKHLEKLTTNFSGELRNTYNNGNENDMVNAVGNYKYDVITELQTFFRNGNTNLSYNEQQQIIDNVISSINGASVNGTMSKEQIMTEITRVDKGYEMAANQIESSQQKIKGIMEYENTEVPQEVRVDTTLYSDDITAFTANLGQLADSAAITAQKIKLSDEYSEAEANASGATSSGSSSKK